GIGAMYENEKWKSLDTENRIIDKKIWKTTSYIRAKTKINEHIHFNLITYYQGGEDRDENIWRSRLICDSNLTILINGRLSFLTNFSLQYDFNPIIPIKGYTYSLTNGIKFDF